jgi:hypothetical protein
VPTLAAWESGNDPSLAAEARSTLLSLHDEKGALEPLLERWLSGGEVVREEALAAVARQPRDGFRGRVLDGLFDEVRRGGPEGWRALSEIPLFVERDAERVQVFLDERIAAKTGDDSELRQLRLETLERRIERGGGDRARAVERLLILLERGKSYEQEASRRILWTHAEGSERIVSAFLAALSRMDSEADRSQWANMLAHRAPLDPRVRSAVRAVRDRATTTRRQLDALMEELAIR